MHSLNLGGTERLAGQTAISLKDDFEVSILCLDEPGLWASEVRRAGVPVHSLWRQPGLDLRLVAQIARFTRRHGIELVHAHQATPWFYAALARVLHGAPRLLFQEHGRHYPEVESRKRALFNRWGLQRFTDRVVAVSEDVKRRLVRYEGISGARIEVVYNGCAPAPPLSESERLRVRLEFDVSDDDFLVGTVGRFDPIKNLPLLVRSVHEARKVSSRVRALLVGDGSCLPDIRELAATLGLDGCVSFAGYRPDAARLAAAMDLFVLASFSEGTSVALLEAMAAGVPAAVTDVGGNPEIVVDGETGWVVPSDDATALTGALLAAVRDPGEVVRRGALARRRFEERFAFEKMVARYRRVYSDLLNGQIANGQSAMVDEGGTESTRNGTSPAPNDGEARGAESENGSCTS